MQEAEFKDAFQSVMALIEAGQDQQAYDQAVALVEKITAQNFDLSKDVVYEFYAVFVRFLLDQQVYEEVIRQLAFAAEYGFKPESQRQLIQELWVAPSLKALKDNYLQNSAQVADLFVGIELPKFEALQFWALPTANNNEFYLFDPEQLALLGKSVFTPEERAIAISRKTSRDFDIVLGGCRDWSELCEWAWYAGQIQKNCYVVADTMYLFAALAAIDFSGLELPPVKIVAGVPALVDFFSGQSASLPRTIIAPFDVKSQIRKALNSVHQKRLTPAGRKGDNILLSICIPSYNRGERAYQNVMNCLSCNYDEEIEVVLSNNGSINETAASYEKIAQLEDARLVYFAYEENQGFPANVCKVGELASGKFILLLSDEDLIEQQGLAALISLLRQSADDCAVVRAKSSFQGGAQVMGIFEAGLPALRANMLSSNYLSGLVFNVELLRQHGAFEYVRENQQNQVCAYYPHMYWELLLCQYGKVYGLDELLVIEGKAEATAFGSVQVDADRQIDCNHYSSFESRLEQHRGFLEIFKTLEIASDPKVLLEMYLRLSSKTLFLVFVAISACYRHTDVDSVELMDKTKSFCLELLDEVCPPAGFEREQAVQAIDAAYQAQLKKVVALDSSK